MRLGGLRAVAVLLALAAILSACGRADAPASQPVPAAPPPVAEEQPPAEPPATEAPPPAPPATETAPPAAKTQPPDELELPAVVSKAREAILAAARTRDYAGLEALLDPATFSYSFGEDGDPIDYWRMLERDGHVPVFGDIMPLVFSTPFAKLGDIYVWPSAAAKEAPDWTAEDIESMRVFYTDEEIDSFREVLGGYYGWRAGIREDGTWLYFVSGD